MNHFLYRRSLEDPLQFLLIEQEVSSEWHIRPFVRDSSIHALGRIAQGHEVDLLQADSESYWQLAASIYASVLSEEALLMTHEGDSLLFYWTKRNESGQNRCSSITFGWWDAIDMHWKSAKKNSAVIFNSSEACRGTRFRHMFGTSAC